MENNLSFPGLICPSRNPFKHESGKVRFGWKKETETKLKFEKDCLDGRRKSIELQRCEDRRRKSRGEMSVQMEERKQDSHWNMKMEEGKEYSTRSIR